MVVAVFEEKAGNGSGLVELRLAEWVIDTVTVEVKSELKKERVDGRATENPGFRGKHPDGLME